MTTETPTIQKRKAEAETCDHRMRDASDTEAGTHSGDTEAGGQNRTVEERKFAKLSLFVKAMDKDTGKPKYVPLEYDHNTGLAGINLKRSMDFQRIYLGHDPIVGFSDEAEYRQWGSMPDGIESPIGWESMEGYMNDYGPSIVRIAAPGADPVQCFASISHNRDDGYDAYMKLDGLWSNEEGSDEEGDTVYPEQSAAYYGGPIEELTFADDSIVDDGVFPGLRQIMKDETLFNPVFWYEFDLMEQAVYTEGEEWNIRQLQNVGLAYYAIPSQLLALAVDKLTRATKRRNASLSCSQIG